MTCIQNSPLNCLNSSPECTENRYFETKNGKKNSAEGAPHPCPLNASTRACGARSLGDSSFLEVWLQPCTAIIYTQHLVLLSLKAQTQLDMSLALSWQHETSLTCRNNIISDKHVVKQT